MDVIVLSSYPEKSSIHGAKTVGVGNYTKATLLALAKCNSDLNFTVLAEIFDEPDDYLENKINVLRIWKRGNIPSIFNAFTKVIQDPAKVVFFPFEMFMFGGFIPLIFTLPMFLLLKLKGKKTILVLHQIIEGNISVFEKNSLKAALFTLSKNIFYSYLLFCSEVVIVFEEAFKERLGNNKKVRVIPHAVIQEKQITKAVAREKLGLDQSKKYVFYFGYLAAYKGVDKLLEIWDDMADVQLIIGGGGNPNHMNKPEYKAFMDKIVRKAKEKNVITTGFIPEELMGTYFSAVDLVIFPYVVFMSSSGPLSHAFSYEKPVILSSALKGYFSSTDMRRILDECQIAEQEICFDLDKPIRHKILWAMTNIEKLTKFSSKMRQVRSWDRISLQYNHEIMGAFK